MKENNLDNTCSWWSDWPCVLISLHLVVQLHCKICMKRTSSTQTCNKLCRHDIQYSVHVHFIIHINKNHKRSIYLDQLFNGLNYKHVRYCSCNVWRLMYASCSLWLPKACWTISRRRAAMWTWWSTSQLRPVASEPRRSWSPNWKRKEKQF